MDLVSRREDFHSGVVVPVGAVAFANYDPDVPATGVIRVRVP